MALRSLRRRPFSLGLLVLAAAAACADPFDTTRTPAPRGTIGQELYGVVCDRIGAQSLHEDLSGASFRAICHPDASGSYASTVDQSQLPAVAGDAQNSDGLTVSAAAQTADRAYAVNRVEALARRRTDLIGSFDTIFPAGPVAVVDTGDADPTKSCTPNGTDSLGNQLTALLSRFQPLYADGTIPQSTESLSRIFDAIKASPDAQAAFTRFQAREGYRPLDLTLGVARPAIAYAGLRDLSNAALALLSGDAQPYNLSKLDSKGNRLPIPGPANTQFNALIAAAHDELLYATQDPAVAVLGTTFDSGPHRYVLNRPRTDLELLETLFYDQSAVYGAGGAPEYIALRDQRGYAKVALVNGAIPAPFQDTNNDQLADVDDSGNFLTTDGSTPPSPLPTLNGPAATRDGCGRAVRGGAASGASDDAGAGQDAGGGQDAASTADGSDAGPSTAGSGDAGTAPAACGAVDPASVIYQYVETSSVFATSLLHNLKPLANPDATAHHETLMYALAGAPVLFGARDGSPKSSKCYDPDPLNPGNCKTPSSLLSYDAFETDSSALVDLVYAFGQMLGDPTMDDTLAYVESLFRNELSSVARLAGDALAMKTAANQHTEAKIPAASTFWDEMLDVTVELEKEPGLLEDVLKALGADGSQNLGQIFASYMTYGDELSYDPANLNGPPLNVTTGSAGGEMVTPVDRTKADTGFNRSAMQRFLSLIHDTDGVTACNKEGAVVHAVGLPLIGNQDVCGSSNGDGALCSVPILDAGERPFHECEVFKIENLAKFYLDSIVGKGSIYFRPSILRNGLCIGPVCVGAATVSLIEESSGIGLNANDTYGFWDATDAKTFRPRPQWLNRLVFFDQANDSPSSGEPNYLTNHFLTDLQGPNIGSSVCPERVIQDPAPTAADASADGMVHGLRTCADGDWLGQRGKGTIFVWEKVGFYQAITPLLSAFVNHGREDIFIDLMETLNRHWADAQGSADECLVSSDPTAKYQSCTKDGVVTYEPLLAQDFQGDIIPALHDLEPKLESLTIPHCTATSYSATNPLPLCTAEQSLDGISVLADATRGLVDPAQALATGLADRHGVKTALRNDGSTNPQVTPIYLLTGALNAMDAAFAAAPSDPNDDRLAQWRLGRSQLVDQFLAVDGAGASSTFDNVAIPTFAPTLIDALRSQLLAQCPTTATPPFTRCAWARDTLTTELTNVVHGPVFAATMDILEALRTDPTSRAQLGQMLEYLLDAASKNDALPSLLATANDIIQVMKDDTNLVPLYQALAPAMAPSTLDAQGQFVQKNAVDASLALLGRISGRAFDASGHEICSAELDPNQILAFALQNLVTPASASSGQAPVLTIMDAIGDVNRADPSKSTSFQAIDYANVADNVSQFLIDPANGLEQFYAVVKNGTVQ